ncbi:MAG: hypothetical protein WA996_19195 [Candidatus Promineifilaceae bacterium]
MWLAQRNGLGREELGGMGEQVASSMRLAHRNGLGREELGWGGENRAYTEIPVLITLYGGLAGFCGFSLVIGAFL